MEDLILKKLNLQTNSSANYDNLLDSAHGPHAEYRQISAVVKWWKQVKNSGEIVIKGPPLDPPIHVPRERCHGP